NCSKVSDEARMVSQSDLLPIRTATRDFEFRIADFGFLEVFLLAIEVVILNRCAICSVPEAPPSATEPSPTVGVLTLFALVKRIPALAVKVAEVFSLDEIKSGAFDVTQQLNNLLVRNRRAFIVGHEPAAPVIGAKGFGFAAGPHFYAAIAHHHQL